jgi:ADP-heptose:LPS heptosyltransferase
LDGLNVELLATLPQSGNVIQDRRKVLLIRFSSFGDVTQCLSVPTRLKELGNDTQIHWVIREDLAQIVENHPHVDRVWTLDRNQGFKGLLKLVGQLRAERFTHIYDAHNNLRSHVISLLLRPPWTMSRIFNPPDFVRKSQKRILRFLLFRLRKNFFEQPFSGQRDLLEPLAIWGLGKNLPPPPQLLLSKNSIERANNLLANWPPAQQGYVVLASSAAYELKRWPIDYWKKLVALEIQTSFVLLGGSDDLFLEEIRKTAPERVLNLAGKASLTESAAVILKARALVANDTGLLHVGEQLGKPTIALMGPAPFGFPSRNTTVILERSLDCRPCSKHGQGPCINPEFQKCLRSISAEEVQVALRKLYL